MDILFRCNDRSGNNTLLANIILTQTHIVLLLLPGARRFSTICFFLFTVDNVTLKDMLVKFLPYNALEHTSKGRPLGKSEDKALACAIACFKDYILQQNEVE